MVNQTTKAKMDKEVGEEKTPEEVIDTPVAEVVPEWAKALMGEISQLKANLEASEEAQRGMAAVIAEQELTLQQVGEGVFPVAPSQPMKTREPVVTETPSGNKRTDR
jgi:hypothetical protein